MPFAIPRSPARWLTRLGLAVLMGTLATGVWLAMPSAPVPVAAPATPMGSSAATIERGRYLATLGNCQGCHTAAGQAAYSGGTAIHTPFGTVYGPNLTPSTAGLGGWSADDFWRALHWGQRPDGQWLSPAFPYTNTTHINRADSDALFAYLQSLPPDDTPNRASELRWPYNTQAALKAWRALYFRPSAAPASTATDTTPLERGRYLVQGLGHCSACHAPRSRWGGAPDALALSGGLLPNGWYAPSLLDPAEAGMQGWALEDAVRLLSEGRHGVHSVQGPMAEVVSDSLRHWTPDDTVAMARYLQSLPTTAAVHNTHRTDAATSVNSAAGVRLYEAHCASCHGAQGQGLTLNNGQMAYPPLAGHRAVQMESAANLLQVVLEGGFGLATPAHPRPFGMPPFQLQLSDSDLAHLLTHIRTAWGNRGSAVSELDVHRMRQSAR
ncbi:MAG: hypothetical protein RL758_2477 [Pseudomonadota bacterium]|jgi:mono/diheme cytochrome c family protein